jgi:hypothetical protein
MNHLVAKVFVASRPVVDLQHCIKQSHGLIRMQDMNKPDIQSFVQAFIRQSGFPEFLGHESEEYILENAQGVFLWVRLVKEELFRYIINGCTKKEIFGYLKSLPKELEGMYNLIIESLSQGKEQDIRDGIKMLQLVFVSRRPLTVAELQHALSISIPDDAEFSPSPKFFEENKVIGIENRIVHCARNFLEIKGHGTFISN